ncbi:GMP reductase, partial [Vibrio parahaemolyticus VPTS-2010]
QAARSSRKMVRLS